MSNLAPIIPFFRYADAPRAVEWLCDAFGFERHAVYEEEGGIGHAELVLGNSMIMLSSPRELTLGMKLAKDTGAPTMGVYIIVDDPDAHYAKAKAAGAKITRDIQDEDYGGRGYTCMDFEGNLWSFGTYAPE